MGGREEIGPVNKGGMDLLNFSLIWWEWRETLRLRSVWTRETGDVMWKEGLAGGGDLAETFFDLHVAFDIKSKCHLIFPTYPL